MLIITCQSLARGCIDDRLALQIFNANNKLYQDHPNASDVNYDFGSLKVVSFDE
jgi:hypothetical protein